MHLVASSSVSDVPCEVSLGWVGVEDEVGRSRRRSGGREGQRREIPDPRINDEGRGWDNDDGCCCLFDEEDERRKGEKKGKRRRGDEDANSKTKPKQGKEERKRGEEEKSRQLQFSQTTSSEVSVAERRRFDSRDDSKRKFLRRYSWC